jgi:diguanylate cyclase (GGDEF)-like protein
MALCTIAGTMSVFHSYYAPLWMAPSFIMLFCSVFHNKKIYRYLLIYSCILVVVSGLFIITEGTLDVSYVIEQCVVAEALTIICSLVAREVSVYQLNVLEITKKSLRNEEKYRNILEYDTLTGVHSRAFMDKVIREVFGVKGGTDQVGFAIIDLDNFKNVNDTYGHDNGDIVLKVLGDLLNKQASDTVIVGRFGGEEFIIVFKDGSLKEYNEQIDVVQSMLNGYSFDFMEERVSFSAGLISCKSSMKYEEVFKLADEALYVSENTGKKKTTVKEII